MELNLSFFKEPITSPFLAASSVAFGTSGSVRARVPKNLKSFLLSLSLPQNGMTPLMHAAYKGKADMCRLLLQHGADVNCNEHEHGYTALMFAGLSGIVLGKICICTVCIYIYIYIYIIYIICIVFFHF